MDYNIQTLTQDTEFIPELITSKPEWEIKKWDKFIIPVSGGEFKARAPNMGIFLFEMFLDSASDNELYETISSINSSFKYPFKNHAYKEVILDLLNGLPDEIKEFLGLKWFTIQFQTLKGLSFVTNEGGMPFLALGVEEIDRSFSVRLLIRMRGEGYTRAKAGVKLIEFLKTKYLSNLFKIGYLWVYADSYNPKTEKLIEHYNEHSRVRWKCLGESEAVRRNGIMHVPKKYRLNLLKFNAEEFN